MSIEHTMFIGKNGEVCEIQEVFGPQIQSSGVDKPDDFVSSYADPHLRGCAKVYGDPPLESFAAWRYFDTDALKERPCEKLREPGSFDFHDSLSASVLCDGPHVSLGAQFSHLTMNHGVPQKKPEPVEYWVQRLLAGGGTCISRAEADEQRRALSSSCVTQQPRAPNKPLVLRPLHFVVTGLEVNAVAADITEWLSTQGYRHQFVGSTCSWRLWAARVPGGYEMAIEICIYRTDREGELIVEVHGVDEHTDKFFVGDVFWAVRRCVLHLTVEEDQSVVDDDLDFDGEIDETKAMLENVLVKVTCGLPVSSEDQDAVKTTVEDGKWDDYEVDLRGITSKSMEVFLTPAHHRQRTLNVCQGALVLLGLVCVVDKARLMVYSHDSFLPTLREYRATIDDADIIKAVRVDKILSLITKPKV